MNPNPTPEEMAAEREQMFVDYIHQFAEHVSMSDYDEEGSWQSCWSEFETQLRERYKYETGQATQSAQRQSQQRIEELEKVLADQRTSLLREFQAVVLLWRYQYKAGTSGMQACNGILEQIGGNPDWQGEPQLKHAQDALFEIYEMVHEKPLAGMAVPTRIVEMVRASLDFKEGE